MNNNSEDKIPTCFVMMPSGNHNEYKGGEEEAEFIFDGIIKKAIENVYGSSIRIEREIDDRRSGAITRSIIQHIAKADLSIVDITGQNPNVFLELGIRYALRKRSTILLKQETTINPFDTHNYRCVVYDPQYRGVEKAINDITDTINSIKSSMKQSYTDSLVWEVYPNMMLKIPDVISEPEEIESLSSQQMTWQEYWDQLKKVTSKIASRFQDGTFVPNLIVGISNGGLIYADLLGRELFRGIPIVSLWADRQSKEGKFFENPINESNIEGIKKLQSELKSEVKKITILLVDDIVASGNTVVQVLNYLKKQITESQILFLPLFSRNEKYFEMIKDDIIWSSDKFKFSEEEIKKIHRTERIKLPYDKEIRST